MEKLAPPVKRYLMGKLPSHSSTQKLADNFKSLQTDTLFHVLNTTGYLSVDHKPTKQALIDGLVDVCENKLIWNLNHVQTKLEEFGLTLERQIVNQEVANNSDEPKWVNLGTIATYFNVTANTIGKWLDELGLRDDNGMGNSAASEQGLCTVTTMNTGVKKTRNITMWNLYPVQQALVDAGHELDFDYEQTLKASGRNSNVQVTTIEERAHETAQEFTKLFKNPNTRKQTVELVQKTPKPVLQKVEVLLQKPGFLIDETYRKYIH